MRTEQLQYLIEISKHKSMNIASQKLHISPQALSTAMKGLEKELNIQLLERTTMGVSLTEDGEKLKEIALQFFYDLADLQSSQENVQKPSIKHLDLHTPYGFCETYLPALLATLYNESYDLEIHSTPHDYLDLIQLVESDTIPFALTYKLFINGQDALHDIPEHMNFTPLYEAKFLAAVHETLPIANYKTISLKTFLEYPVVSYTPAAYLMKPLYHYHQDVIPKLINVPTTGALISMLNTTKSVTFSMQDTNTKAFALAYPENMRIIAFREKIQVIYGYITKKNKPLSSNAIAQLRYLDRLYHAE